MPGCRGDLNELIIFGDMYIFPQAYQLYDFFHIKIRFLNGMVDGYRTKHFLRRPIFCQRWHFFKTGTHRPIRHISAWWTYYEGGGGYTLYRCFWNVGNLKMTYRSRVLPHILFTANVFPLLFIHLEKWISAAIFTWRQRSLTWFKG